MFKYLVKSAVDVLKDEGIGGLTRETLKYLSLYGSPRKVLGYKVTRALNQHLHIIRDVQGSKMALDLSGNGIHGDLYMYGKREPEATDVMQRIITADMTVLDIGANIGYYALMESKRCKKVYAVEPSNDNFENLQRNILLNGYKNIESYKLAIGDHNGSVKFLLNDAPNWHRVATADDKNTVDVSMLTLDDFWANIGRPKIDLLRMDVEGYELNILRGGKSLIEQCKPRMFLEVHRDHIKKFGGSALELLQLLAGYGYSLTDSFVLGKPCVTGEVSDLLTNERSAYLLTQKGMATHLFFGIV